VAQSVLGTLRSNAAGGGPVSQVQTRDDMAKSTILKRVDKLHELEVKRPTSAYQYEINRIVNLAINDLLELAASGQYYRTQSE
jgi:hypothetical protein